MGAREAEQVQAYLKGLGMEFRVVTHEAVYTSEAAAKAVLSKIALAQPVPLGAAILDLAKQA